jgi:hypothetical protein
VSQVRDHRPVLVARMGCRRRLVRVAWRKGHRYLTLVTDHRSGRVVWGAEGKDTATCDQSFAELGTDRAAQLAAVSGDSGRCRRRSGGGCSREGSRDRPAARVRCHAASRRRKSGMGAPSAVRTGSRSRRSRWARLVKVGYGSPAQADRSAPARRSASHSALSLHPASDDRRRHTQLAPSPQERSGGPAYSPSWLAGEQPSGHGGSVGNVVAEAAARASSNAQSMIDGGPRWVIVWTAERAPSPVQLDQQEPAAEQG